MVTSGGSLSGRFAGLPCQRRKRPGGSWTSWGGGAARLDVGPVAPIIASAEPVPVAAHPVVAVGVEDLLVEVADDLDAGPDGHQRRQPVGEAGRPPLPVPEETGRHPGERGRGATGLDVGPRASRSPGAVPALVAAHPVAPVDEEDLLVEVAGDLDAGLDGHERQPVGEAQLDLELHLSQRGRRDREREECEGPDEGIHHGVFKASSGPPTWT